MSNLAQLWPFEAEKISQIDTLLARELAKECKKHITWVRSLPPVLSEAYRIDVTIKDATITTRVDVVNLIKMLHGEAVRRDEEAAQLDGDAQYQKEENVKLLAKHAQKYANKHFFSPPEEGRHSDDPTALPPAKSVCNFKEGCNWYKQKVLNKLFRQDQVCPVNDSKMSHRERKMSHLPCQVFEGTSCGFILPMKNCLKGLGPVAVDNVDMYLIRRQSCTRDLLFMPEVMHAAAPSKPIREYHLHNNVQFVQDEGAWKSLLEMLRRVRNRLDGTDGFTTSSPLHDIVGSVSFNFGKWESGVSRNPGATNCHAHAHILLTRNAAIALGKTNEEFKGYLDLPKKDNHVLDIHQLSSYTSSLTLSDLQTEVGDLKTDVGDLKTEVADLKKEVTIGFSVLSELIRSLHSGKNQQPPGDPQ